MSKNIALFGGSFDPPHLAHVQIVEELSKKYDQVWILPSAAHAFKKDQSSFLDRLKLCELSFSNIPQVKIMDVEKDLSGYAIDTVKFLKANFPNCQFTWILGSDLLKQLDQWKEADQLKQLIKFETLPRAPQEKSPFLGISSTEIRKKAQQGKSLKNLVVPQVEAYIKEHKLY